MRIFAVALIFMLALPLQGFNTLAAGHTLQIRLRIPGTRGNVYIPSAGQGEALTSALENATLTSPIHYYLASSADDTVKALVYQRTTPVSITVNRSGSGEHILEINQYLESPIIYLVFTEGDWNRIEHRIYMIEYGIFMKSISPSFAYGLGTLYHVTIMLRYPNIDILRDLMLQSGQHELEFSLINKYNGSSQLLVDVAS